MAAAHLLAQDLLGLREVRHVDPLVTAGDITLVSGRRQPDLVGFDTYDAWAVVEAKGRSNAPEPDVLTKAKGQAENVNLVRNSTGTMISPMARVASLTDISTTPLHTDFVDPPDPEKEDERTITTYGVEPDVFVRSYFASIEELGLLMGGLTAEVPGIPEDLNVQGARLPGTRLWLAVDTGVRTAYTAPDSVVERVRDAQEGWESRTRERRRRLDVREPEAETAEDDLPVAPDDAALTSVGPDGYVVHFEF